MYLLYLFRIFSARQLLCA